MPTKEQTHQYYLTRKAKMMEESGITYWRKYYESSLDSHKKATKKYTEKNRDKIRDYQSDYYLKNIEKFRERDLKRREKLKQQKLKNNQLKNVDKIQEMDTKKLSECNTSIPSRGSYAII